MVGTFNSLESTFVRDVTGDGIADWVHLDDGGVNAIRVWPGRGDGTFSRATLITTTPANA